MMVFLVEIHVDDAWVAGQFQDGQSLKECAESIVEDLQNTYTIDIEHGVAGFPQLTILPETIKGKKPKRQPLKRQIPR